MGDSAELELSDVGGDNGPPAHPLGVPGNGSASPARHSGARASFGQHREVVKMATASSFLAHMEVQSGFVAKRRRGVLSMPTGRKDTKGHSSEEETYNIIGKCLDSDPWENEPEYKEQVAYIPKAWSSVPTSVWVPNINWIVFVCVALMQALMTLAVYYTSDSAPGREGEEEDSCQGFCGSWLELDPKAHTHTGLALFLLLSFRANSSYDRFWEGRKLWGLTINRTRDLARQMVHYIKDDAAQHRRMLAFVVAFAVTKKRHLRDERGLQELSSILSVQDMRNIQEAEHMPLFVLDVLSDYINSAYARGAISDHILQLMDNNITTFQDTLGGCERIKKTPIPVCFVVHMRAFMVLWLATLPLTLAQALGWTSVAIALIVAFAILGIDAMAVEIENPFGHDFNDLPLGMICETIAKNVREILDRAQHPDRALAMAGKPALW